MKLAIALLAIASTVAVAADRKAVFPPNVKPIGPFSPGIQSGDFLYVSGQGARDGAGKLVGGVEPQAKQVMENVKAIVETGGLQMKDVIYTQVYLADMASWDGVEKVMKTYFPAGMPVHCVVGMKRMPTDTPIEISAVVSTQPGKRVYLPGASFEAAGKYLAGKGLKMSDVAFANVYFTRKIQFDKVDKQAKKAFKPGTTIVYVPVNALPGGAATQITGIAGQTDVYSVHTGTSADQILGDIKNDLAKAGLTMDNVVAANVYVDNIDNFAAMNKIYATFFNSPHPTRTTVQPEDPTPVTGNTISVIAVK